MTAPKKRFLFWFFLFLSFFRSGTFCYAQKFPSVRYSINDGLPNSLVFQMVCDTKGYMWFATDNGLSKFDGKKFANFYSDIKRPDYIIALTEDKNGRIIAGSYGNGLLVVENGKLEHLKIEGLSDKLYVLRLISDEQNNLWLYDGHSESVYVIAPDNKFTQLTKSVFSDQITKVNSFCVHENNSVFVGTSHGAFSYDLSSKKSTKVQGIEGEIHDIIKNGKKYIFTSIGCVYVLENNAVQKINIAGAEKELFIKALPNNDGSFYLAGFRGKFYRIGTKGTEDLSDKFLLQNSTVTNAIYDKEGNVWIGTYGTGALCYFNFDIINYSVKDGLSGNYVTGLAEYDSIVFASAFNSQGRLNYFKDDSARTLKIDETAKDIIYIGELSKNELLVCLGSTLYNYILSGSENKFSIKKHPNKTIIRSVLNYDNTIYLGTYQSGLLTYSNATTPFDENKVKELKGRTVNGFINHAGNFYAGTDSGLYIFNKDLSYVNSFHEKEGLQAKRVISVLPVNNSIWILTELGISVLSNDNSLTPLTTSQLPQKTTFTSFVYDKNNFVWIGTQNGLYQYDLTKKELTPFNAGLVSREVLKLFIDSRNCLWVGTSDGISKIDLTKSNQKINELWLYVNTITLDGSPINNNSSDVNLNYNFKKLSINVSAPVFRDALSLRYLYAFHNENQKQIKWEELKEGNIDLFNLKSGDYELWIRAEQRTVHRESQILKYKIYVSYPFWQRWWFFGALILIVLFISYRAALVRIKKIRHQEKEKAELQIQFLELEQKALSALIHPHFIFNALNSIQIYISKNQKELAHNFLSKFARLIRLTLESVYQKEVLLDEEVERLSLYMDLENLRLNNQFTFAFTIDDNLDTTYQKVPTMLIQPFIENAIWHGIKPMKDLKGEIKIVLKKINDDQLEITISDNGMGINAAKKNKQEDKTKSSLGLKITVERLELLSKMKNLPFGIDIKDISDLNPAQSGTKVTILVPLS